MVSLRLALVVCVVLLAGCSGIDTGIGETDREPYGVDEPAVVANPADDESDETISADPDFGGVEDSEPERVVEALESGTLEDPVDLRVSHDAGLEDVSHTLVVDSETRHQNGTVVDTSEMNAAISAGGSQLHVEDDRGGNETRRLSDDGEADVDRIESWEGSGIPVHRFEYTDGTVEYADAVWGVSASEGMVWQGLDGLDEVTIEASERDGADVYALSGETTEPSTGFVANETEPLTVEAVVTDDGVVVESEITGPIDDDGAERTLVESFELTSVGETDVERPDWVGDARSQS